MKVITYVKREMDTPYVKVEHEVKKNFSAEEQFKNWSNICYKAMNAGKIVDYQVELAYTQLKK